MLEGSDCWAGLLWFRDTAGNIASMANFLSKQLRHVRVAQKITAWWGVNNSAIWWCQRYFACVFHKLEPPSLTPLQNKHSQKHVLLLQPPGVAGREREKNDWQTLCHLKWRRSSLLRPELNHPSDCSLGIILHWGVTSMEMVSRSSFLTSATPFSISQRAEHFLVYQIYHFIGPVEREITF